MSVITNKDTSNEEQTTETRYIEAKLEHSEKIKELRNDLFTKFIESDKYRKVNPHITIIPPFVLPKQNIDALYTTISTLDLENTKVIINGLSVWPSLENPRVILLDVELTINLSKYRKQITKTLQNLNAKITNQPVSAHITLFKAENGHEIKDSSKDQLQQFIWDNRENGSWSTTIEYIDIPLTE